MQVVILAAGLGTRMGELTKSTPKPLLKIKDKALLEHSFEALPPEIDEVVLVVGYLAHQIKDYIGNLHDGRKVKYIEQKELNGTGHALSLCKENLHGRFLVLMADDVYSKEDLQKLIQHPLAILSYVVSGKSKNDFHALIKTDSSGKLLDIVERQKAKIGDQANCGAYVLDERFFELPLVPAGNKTKEFGLPQTMLQLVRQGVKFEIVPATSWHSVSAPGDLEL